MRASIISGTIQIPDDTAILMRTSFKPLGNSSKDKVCLMLARPYILIPREMVEQGVKDIQNYSKSMWEHEYWRESDDEHSGKPVELTKTVDEILQKVVDDVLGNSRLKSIRDFNGAPGNNTFVLGAGHNCDWPKGFQPEISGSRRVSSKPEPFATDKPHVLGIRLNQFFTNLSVSEINDRSIEVQIFNAGGSAGGAACGSARLTYSVRRLEDRWGIKLVQVSDP